MPTYYYNPTQSTTWATQWTAAGSTTGAWANTPTTAEWSHTTGSWDSYNIGQGHSIGPGYYRPAPQPRATVCVAEITREFIEDVRDWSDALRATVQRLADSVEQGWERDHGEMNEDLLWHTWVTNTPEGNLRVSVALAEEAWQHWAGAPVMNHVAPGRPRVPTAEEAEDARLQVLRSRERAEEAARVREERAREKREADERAERLLRRHLNDEQRADWERANHFELLVGERRYQIARGFQGNVYLLDENGNRQRRYCAHGDSQMPEADHCLEQKLLLEANEAEFLRIANESAA